MNNDQITLITVVFMVAVAIAACIIRSRFRHEFIVNEGFTNLLYHQGKIIAALPAGRHIRWGENFRSVTLDIRKTLLAVPGQEVLSADNINVKVSIVLTTQIIDAVKSAQAVDSWGTHIYNAAQSAVRTAVAGVNMDVLLQQRISINTQIMETLAPLAETVGVKIHSVEVRDVMLPGDLRKAFADVLKAKKAGEVSLERARGESAALRNLANAARLVECQPALATLRFLQTLETSDAKQTVVMNDMSAFAPTLATRNKQ